MISLEDELHIAINKNMPVFWFLFYYNGHEADLVAFKRPQNKYRNSYHDKVL